MVLGNIYFIAAVSVVGGGLFGFDISSQSAIIGTQQYLCYFNQNDQTSYPNCQGPTASVQGGITASMPGGSFIGALVSGVISDRLGRKTSIMIGCVVWVIGSIIYSASVNIPMLVVGRFINGICVGICSAQIPVYISELAPPTLRGRLVGAQQWAITWGIMIMFYVSFGTSYIHGDASFRIPWALQTIPAILLFIGCFFLPESPRWLARKDKWEECHAVLTLVHGKGDPHSPFVAREYMEIQETWKIEREGGDASWLDLLKPDMINRTQIGFFTQVWAQLVGMNVMMYYITYVFTMAGETGNTLLVSSSIQYIINVVMTIPALLYMDRWGRRPTLMVGSFSMMIWMFVTAGVLASKGVYVPGGVHNVVEAKVKVTGGAAKMVIAAAYLAVASFAPSWGPVSWTYPPELYPLRVRGKAVALSTSGNWIFNFALSYFVPPSFEEITWRTYILFGVFCFVATLHVFFMFPETAGKPLEEVEAIFTDPHGPKYIGTPAWKTRGHYRTALEMERGDFFNQKRMSTDGEWSYSPDRGTYRF